MKLFLTTTVSLGVLCLTAGAAFAECGIEGTGSVRILSNDFEALRLVNSTAEECATDGITVTANANAEHKNLQVPALTINPARLLGVDAGTLREGTQADLAIVDPDKPWVVESDKMAAAAGNTPFDKRPVQGRAVALFKGGAKVA